MLQLSKLVIFKKHFSTNTQAESSNTQPTHTNINRIKRFKAQNTAIKIVCSLISCVFVCVLYFLLFTALSYAPPATHCHPHFPIFPLSPPLPRPFAVHNGSQLQLQLQLPLYTLDKCAWQRHIHIYVFKDIYTQIYI